MKATKTENQILASLRRCRFLPGSFDKRMANGIDAGNLSPLQRWWVYRLGYKYRRQIGDDAIEFICKTFLDANQEPPSRRDSERLLRDISKT